MHVRSLIKLGVVAAACAGGLAVVAPTATAAPDVNNFITYTGDNETGLSADYQCFQGAHYPVVLLPVVSARNNCEYHVYLQYPGGRSDCINPKSTRNGILPINQDPISVQIGPGTSNC